jgi:hypothetical protein
MFQINIGENNFHRSTCVWFLLEAEERLKALEHLKNLKTCCVPYFGQELTKSKSQIIS